MAPTQIIAMHPGPWQRVTHPNGLIQAFDARGQEVPLLTILDLAEGVVAGAAARQAPPQPTPAA